MPSDQPRKAAYQAAGATHRGLRRAQNEDCYAVHLDSKESAGESAGDFVVCDGMGGAVAGELASRIATDTMIAEVSAMSRELLASGRMQQAVSAANLSVYSRARRDPSLAGMGTTLVALAVRGGKAWVAHVGDSRCYRWRDGMLERLTQDHSLVEEQVRSGKLTPAQAAVSPLRNIITRAVGTEPQVAADILETDVASGEMYLLASDGLTREVAEPEIADILRGAGPPAWICAELIQAANQAGGSDNITCVLVRAR